jgi:hypothetical protein
MTAPNYQRPEYENKLPDHCIIYSDFSACLRMEPT